MCIKGRYGYAMSTFITEALQLYNFDSTRTAGALLIIQAADFA